MLELHDFSFQEENDKIEATFLRIFSLQLKGSELRKIGRFSVNNNKIFFPDISQQKAERHFYRILNTSFSTLKNRITNNPAIYIHRNSGIPLIGCLSFGIIDKGTDMIEIKPITGCNLDCIFCSVDEGISSKKTVDFVIEKDYLVQETKKLLEYKKKACHIYLNPHGEPLLYADIIPLVSDLSSLNYIKGISIITNATLLTEKLAKSLIKAGLTGFNISINALKSEKAKQLAGTPFYNIDAIKKLIPEIKGKAVLTPVFVDKINNEDIEDLIQYAAKYKIPILIQNFLMNKRGRKPAKELKMQEFYEKLRLLEKKHKVGLITGSTVEKTDELPQPFRRGDIIKAEISLPGRYKNESLAVASNRIITVRTPFCQKQRRNLKITGAAHNIFYAEMV